MIGYMRKLIRENRALRRKNADLIGTLNETSDALMETVNALTRSTNRNVLLGQELEQSTATIRFLMAVEPLP